MKAESSKLKAENKNRGFVRRLLRRAVGRRESVTKNPSALRQAQGRERSRTASSANSAVNPAYCPGYISVCTTLEQGEKLVAGNCTIENVEGEIIVGVDKGLAFLIRRRPSTDSPQAFHVKCYSDAERIPEKVASRPKLKAESSKLKANPPFDSAHGPAFGSEAQARREPVEGKSEIHNLPTSPRSGQAGPQSSVPLCIFGPGGDFVREYTP